MTDTDKRNSISREIFVATLVAVIVSIINYVVWQQQNEVGQEQKLYENKLSAIEKFASTTSKFIYYNEFTVRMKLEQFRSEQKIRDSIYSASGKLIDTLSGKYTNRIQTSLEKRFPLQYSMHLKNLEFQSEAKTNILLPTFIFDNKTSEKLKELNDTFTEENIRNEISKIMKSKSVNIYDVNVNDLVTKFYENQNKLLSETLSQMYEEVKS